MLSITRVTDGTPTLILSGRTGVEQLPDVRRAVETEQTLDLVLDLSEVTLVDAESSGSSCAVSSRASASPIVPPTFANGWPARSGRGD
jgi:hypothetical protein